jgi:hypothetical protein
MDEPRRFAIQDRSGCCDPQQGKRGLPRCFRFVHGVRRTEREREKTRLPFQDDRFTSSLSIDDAEDPDGPIG